MRNLGLFDSIQSVYPLVKRNKLNEQLNHLQIQDLFLFYGCLSIQLHMDTTLFNKHYAQDLLRMYTIY